MRITPQLFFKIFLFIFLLISQNIFSQTYQWRQITNGPAAQGSRLEDVYFINNNTGWVIDIDGLVYKTNDGGKNWTTVFSNFNYNGFRSVAFFDSARGVVGSLDFDSCLYLTTNGGVNWKACTNITGTVPRGVCGLSIVSPDIIFGTGRYSGNPVILKSTDRGDSWTSLNFGSQVTALVDVYFLNKDTGFVCGGAGPVLSGRTKILRTTNSGASWDSVYSATTLDEWGWKFNFINKTTGYCSVENSSPGYFLKTTNAGTNWSRINYGFNLAVQGIGFLNENTGWIGGGHYPLGITSSTYATTNGGTNWTLVPNMVNVNVFQLLNDTLGFAVGRKVYRYGKDSIVNVENISTFAPSRFELKQNYPNPFNPVTNVEFQIVNSGSVKLKIFDMLGKEVETLVNQNLNAGSYKVQWDAARYTSGMYFYKLETENFSDTKKMILLK
jgi:photosystem II stability/assembly factor-like uncharacterized protein